MKISTSILSSKDRTKSINKLNKTNTDYIHIDVMDGNFVPNCQMPLTEILDYEKISEKKLDIHLMVNDPIKYIEKLDNKNIEFITFHIEINKDINEIIKSIKDKGYKVGIAIKPNTNEELLNKYLNKIEMVLVMTVEPGKGGQKFIKEMINKAIYIREKNKNILIEMDGGINDETIKDIKDKIDISVVGSYITNKDNYNNAINELKN